MIITVLSLSQVRVQEQRGEGEGGEEEGGRGGGCTTLCVGPATPRTL